MKAVSFFLSFFSPNFLFCIGVSENHSVLSNSATSWTVAHQAPLCMECSRKDTGMGCHFLLQGIFLTQGSNPGVLHSRQIPDHLSHQGSCIGEQLFNQAVIVSHGEPRDSTIDIHVHEGSFDYARARRGAGPATPCSGTSVMAAAFMPRTDLCASYAN